MKRGESGLSLVVAVDKPSGMTSHDVVNRCRRIFGERRVGHTGTLDPLATGVLPICVGPATRLDQYMTGHDKRYRVDIAFGYETTTDDVEGQPTVSGEVLPALLDEQYARTCLQGFLGCGEQVPPQYSAIKVDGKKAYQVARGGGEAALAPRPVEVYEAALQSVFVDGQSGLVCWRVDFSVSKGTYIRALARDIGRLAGCPAHVFALQRVQAGAITLADCVSLQTLENLAAGAAIDPIAATGFRFCFADGYQKQLQNGSAIPGDSLRLYEPPRLDGEACPCGCTGTLVASDEAPHDAELVCMVMENRLKAIYAYAAAQGLYKPECVFSIGVLRT